MHGTGWVPQIRGELQDSYQIQVSDDAIEDVIARYQAIVAAREQDPERLAEIYRDVDEVVLSIDGLQPEKGHETLYVVRELTQKRVWFGEPLVSSSAPEVRRLIARAREWAERLGKRVRLWMSDKQDAFLTGIAAEFPAVPHRFCQNHFLRDVAQPMLEADSHAKVRMRSKVRGLRAIEKDLLAAQRAEELRTETDDIPGDNITSEDITTAAMDENAPPPLSPSNAVVLDYCTAVKGILNDDQGGPLHPPGLRMVDPAQGDCETRRARFSKLQSTCQASADLVRQQMANVLLSFEPRLFSGGDIPGLPLDNLDLERWFRNPKGHERRIHGHRHAGVRIVLEGPSMIHALDLHQRHPEPLTSADLLPDSSHQPTPVAPTPQPHAPSTLNKETTSTSRAARISVQRLVLARQRAVESLHAASGR